MIKALVLPAYNEEKHIAHVVRRALPYVDYVIVVDNCSTDNTLIQAKQAGAISLHHIYNLGKSGSLHTGCQAAIRLGADIIAFMDSDGQHNPEDLPRFFAELEHGNYDMVIGARAELQNMPLVRLAGTKMIKWMSRLLYGLKASDIQSGFRIFKAGIYEKIKWTSTGSSHYFADAEITIRVAMQKLKYTELPIETIYLDKYKGMDPLQGMYLLFKIFIWRFLLWLT